MVDARSELAARARLHPDVITAVRAVAEVLCMLVQDRLSSGVSYDAFRGLHLNAADAEQMLATPPLPWDGGGEEPVPLPVSLPAPNGGSPLESARRGLGLDLFESAVVALCLIPELDGRYGQLIGYLHDDITRKRPSVELALTLLAPNGTSSLDYLTRFMPGGRLRTWRLLQPLADDALIRQSLVLDNAFLWFLLGSPDLDPSLANVARVVSAEHGFHTGGLETLASRLGAELAAGAHVLLYGEDEHSALMVAAAAAEGHGRSLLVIDGATLAAIETADMLLLQCCREAVVRGMVPCITRASTLLQEATGSAAACRRWIQQFPLPLLLISPSASGEVAYAGRDVVPIGIPAPSAQDRYAYWQDLGNDRHITFDERTLLSLAETEGLTGALIEEVAAAAEGEATAAGDPTTGKHVQRAARSILRQRAPSLTLVQPRFVWEDIVLPEDKLVILRHLCSRVRYRSRVQRTWGLGRGTVPGVTALFAGQPGTGKSMAAEVIAADLGVDLCKIDLAQVVSKYIGETEKNLARIFDEAEQCGVVLVFDEADALFGKRSDVKDSHDRYANIETSYLLQRMERYHGLAVLTTNLRANLDDAFTRRIGVSIDFPLPTPEDRLRLWKRAVADAPCDGDLNLTEVADRLELAGGAIMNAALAAAYLAAEEDDVITSDRLLRGVRWELQKMGRLMSTDAMESLLPASVRAARAHN